MESAVFVRRLVKVAEERRPSDIFISPKGVFLKIRGALVKLEYAGLSEQDVMGVVAVLVDGEPAHFVLTEDIDTTYLLDSPSLSGFRVNAFRSMSQPAAVLRVIEREIKSFASLGIPMAVQSTLEKLADLKEGLILVAGTTGSGKSSTLRAMIKHVNDTRDAHILWIEDPQEVTLRSHKSLVTQRQIPRDAEDWITALRSALRQSADVIVLGEIRLAKVMETALEAAQTGHLVLATYHGRDAVDTLNRIIGAVAAEEAPRLRTQLARSVRAIVVQRLLRRQDGGDGRIPAIEILLGAPDVASAIARNGLDDLVRVMENGVSSGMQSMQQALHSLATRNKITWETVRRG